MDGSHLQLPQNIEAFMLTFPRYDGVISYTRSYYGTIAPDRRAKGVRNVTIFLPHWCDHEEAQVANLVKYHLPLRTLKLILNKHCTEYRKLKTDAIIALLTPLIGLLNTTDVQLVNFGTVLWNAARDLLATRLDEPIVADDAVVEDESSTAAQPGIISQDIDMGEASDGDEFSAEDESVLADDARIKKEPETVNKDIEMSDMDESSDKPATDAPGIVGESATAEGEDVIVIVSATIEDHLTVENVDAWEIPIVERTGATIRERARSIPLPGEPFIIRSKEVCKNCDCGNGHDLIKPSNKGLERSESDPMPQWGTPGTKSQRLSMQSTTIFSCSMQRKQDRQAEGERETTIEWFAATSLMVGS